jgi:replication factor A1
MLLADVKDKQLGAEDQTDFFSARATTMHVKPENLTYPACPSENCNKKVTDVADGSSWRCEKCDKSYPAPEHRFVILRHLHLCYSMLAQVHY